MTFSVPQRLRAAVAGGVVLPSDDRYEADRLSWHRTIDPQPAVVLDAAGPDDVRAAVIAASEHDVALLAEVKRAWDPANVFGLGHNIAPAPEEARHDVAA